MANRTNGEDDPDREEDKDLAPRSYEHPDPSGGTVVADRDEHPNAHMEAKFREAEGVGFKIEQRTSVEWGMYYRLEDECQPPHLGTVNEKEVYAIEVDRILRRCPKWRAWKDEQEPKEGT
jgi:hypothetical protein